MHDEEEFVNTVREGLSDKSGEYVMTIAEKFKQKGREEGREEAVNTMAMRLIKQGMALEDIADVTGLPLAVLEKLCADEADL